MITTSPPPAAIAADDPGAAVTVVWRAPRRAALRRAGEPVLTVLAVLGAACLAATVAMAALRVTPLVVRSGSMEPALPVGSMVLVRPVPAAEVVAGDVVSVERPDGTRVTHRVAEVGTVAGPLRRVTLQGDRNPVPDPEPVVTATVDRALLVVPGAGRVLQAAGTPPALFAAGVLVGVALWTAFAPPVARERGRWLVLPAGADATGAGR